MAGRYLYITARQYDYAVHLRVAGWIQRLPRPIISELLYPLLHYVGRSLIQSGMQVIVNLSSCKDLQVFMPGCNHTLSIFAWAGLMNIQALFKHDSNDQDWTGRRHKSHLDSFETTIAGLYPTITGVIMPRLKAWVARVKPHEEARGHLPQSRNAWEPSAGGASGTGNGAFHPATSDLRHQPAPALDYGIEYPPSLSTFPAGGNVGLLPPPGTDFAGLGSGGGMPAAVPFLGEFTAQEMAAFEAWWFDMLEVDGTPSTGGMT